jgi:hypothetical protein
MTRQAAMLEHGVSEEELTEWLQRYGEGGLSGRRRLRATSLRYSGN